MTFIKATMQSSENLLVEIGHLKRRFSLIGEFPVFGLLFYCVIHKGVGGSFILPVFFVP